MAKKRLPTWDTRHKPVATWLRLKDYNSLQEIAERSNVGVAAYVRGIIVDAIQDEQTKYSIALLQPRIQIKQVV